MSNFKYNSTLLVQENTIEEVQKADLDLLKKINETASTTDASIASVKTTADDTSSEVIAARGQATTLGDRIGVVANFASPNAGGIVSGFFYDNSFQGSASSTLAGAAGRLDLAPFYTSIPLKVDQIGVAVSTLIAGALGRVVIYSTGADGWPDTLLFQGTTSMSFASTGYKYHDETFSFKSGTQYWIGVHQSSTATLRTVNIASAVNLGLTSSTATSYFSVLRRTITYTSGAPAKWNFVSSDLVSATPPSIRFRVGV